MITKPKDWESAMSYDGESGKRMTPGGHVCQITNIRQEKSKAGKPMIVVSFDIAEGSDLDGFYITQYREAKKNGRDAKWSGVIRYLLYDDNGLTNPFFKGFIKSLEESNPGYAWDWNEGSAAGKGEGHPTCQSTAGGQRIRGGQPAQGERAAPSAPCGCGGGAD